ncbi:unnamed protein product [Rotaria sp. Silwood2]|nr:unnamed protein product [Rotaria sp. Silwood2]CAF4584561.1 unnamed protein product [Rotaria sp. Silwood2]
MFRFFSLDNFRSALNYQAQPDDIFILTYPKSGTTWMQVILYTLMNDGKAFDDDMGDYFARTPFLDTVGEKGLKNMHKPYVMKTHIPFNRLSYNQKAKYICVIRNPKDVCVSLYHFSHTVFGIPEDQKSFDVYFENFINGNIVYGNYFKNLAAVWQHRNDGNVFLTSFEEMKQNLSEVIRRLAQFMNIELKDNLLDHTMTYSSLSYMKERFDKAYRAQASIALAAEELDSAWPMDRINLEVTPSYVLVREGAVGKWSSIMSEEQAQRLDKIFAEKMVDMPGFEKFFIQ